MHVSPRALHEYPWYLRPFFWNQRRKYGQALMPALVWGRSPRLFLAVAAMFGVLNRRSSPLPPDLRSVVGARIAQINHCRFCIDLNAAILARRTGSVEKLALLEDWRSSTAFDERERAALEYAEAVTGTDGAVSDELLRRVTSVFEADALVELTGFIAFQNLSSKFNRGLGIPSQGLCRSTARRNG